MLRGIYTAASGMLAQGIRTDVLANNLANVDTRLSPPNCSVQAFPEQLLMRQER